MKYKKHKRKIAALKQKRQKCIDVLWDIQGVLVCVGGPLNDNLMKYTKEQLKPFLYIFSRLESVL